MRQDVNSNSPDWIERTEEEQTISGAESEDGFVPGHNHESLH